VRTDFRAKLQTILEQQSSRYVYLEANKRHYIVCNIRAEDTSLAITTLVEGMRDNQSLSVMKEGRDYRWEGAAMISFKSKTFAALFSLCCPYG